MVKVKIIAGTYGYNNGSCVELKGKNSEPFLVSDEEASRLVKMRVAEIVTDNNELKNDSGDTENKADTLKGEADLNAMTNKQLKEMAENMGLDTSKMKVKQDFVDAITKAFEESSFQNDGEGMPKLGMEDPIV